MSFVYYRQLNAMDCGPTCLRMIARKYGKNINNKAIRNITGYNKEGVSLLGISKAAEKIGFETQSVQIDYDKLLISPLPAIIHWDQNHFVVLISIDKKKVKIANPASGIVVYTKNQFLKYWVVDSGLMENSQKGIALLLEPSATFYEKSDKNKIVLDWKRVVIYLKKSKLHIIFLLVLLIASSLLQLIPPILTKNMVDKGINTKNLHFITVILIAQLLLVFSTTVIGFISSRLQLKLSNLISKSLLTDFWTKLTNLPLSYFEAHQTGDVIQRIDDNKQIQNFFTGQALNTLLAIFNFISYSVIISFYNFKIFLVFITGSLFYYGWIQLFSGFRRKLNYETFYASTKENNATLQLVQGMQDIRLNNAEKSKRKEWDSIQSELFKLSFKNLNYTQVQSTGALFISQGKDVIISFLAAELVVKGQVSFGTMLAIQYIIGQLNGPLTQFIGVSQSLQDAKISMERLNEIHEMDDEEPASRPFILSLPEHGNIEFKNLSFSYPGFGNKPVLSNIHFVIPKGKVTAIVGVSGSGKTTLLKILLKIYQQYEGQLKIGDTNFSDISAKVWRNHCGAVLQDGYIFNDSIVKNIAIEENVDERRLLLSCQNANILDYIESLPNGYATQLGTDGIGISQGQKQRLLIARAFYKNPQYLFFDEATNSLDANNEKIIVKKMQCFFDGKTVVVAAHRLSTVRNADNILVLHEGQLIEQGTHNYLTSIKGAYYQLIKDQLELED